MRVSDRAILGRHALYVGETAFDSYLFFFLNYKLKVLFHFVARRLSYLVCMPWRKLFADSGPRLVALYIEKDPAEVEAEMNRMKERGTFALHLWGSRLTRYPAQKGTLLEKV